MQIFILFYSFLFQAAPLTVISPDFPNEGNIPPRFTCDGEDINPTIIINGIPEGTKSLVLIGEDPDAPLTTFTQWIIWNIKPTDTILENTVPGNVGINTVGKTHYRGPCATAGTQRYVFKVYALDSMLKLKADAKRSKVDEAMEGHILAFGQLMGIYNRAIVISEKGK